MSVYHKELAAGRWRTFPFLVQMANVGSEVERALKWKAAGDEARFRPAYERALELLDLTARYAAGASRLRELRRAREVLADYFDGANEWKSTPAIWQTYFDAFTHAARRSR